MATINDIAKLSQTSVATVSYVLNGKATEHHISETTQERVRSVADRLNYRPSVAARRLQARMDEKIKIAFFWPEFYFEQSIISAMRAIRDIQTNSLQTIEINIIFFIPDHLPEKLDENTYLDHNGVVVLGASVKDLDYLSLQRTSVPIVIANRQKEGIPSVSIDSRLAGQLAFQVLHERVGDSFLAIWETRFHISPSMRKEAFLACCAEAKIDIKDRQYSCDGTSEDGYNLAASLIRRNLLRKAVYCNNESISFGFMAALLESGYKVGTDVLLLSSNNGPSSVCRYHVPALTAIELKMEEVLSKSLRLCLSLIMRTSDKEKHFAIEPELVLRDSFPAE